MALISATLSPAWWIKASAHVWRDGFWFASSSTNSACRSWRWRRRSLEEEVRTLRAAPTNGAGDNDDNPHI